MRWKHLFTAWKNAQNPIGLPRKNEAETAATSQRHNRVAVNTVYPTWNPVSTASQEEAQIPADIDGAAVQEAAANLRQELEHLNCRPNSRTFSASSEPKTSTASKWNRA